MDPETFVGACNAWSKHTAIGYGGYLGGDEPAEKCNTALTDGKEAPNPTFRCLDRVLPCCPNLVMGARSKECSVLHTVKDGHLEKKAEELPGLLDSLCLNRRLGLDATFEETSPIDTVLGKYIPMASTFEVVETDGNKSNYRSALVHPAREKQRVDTPPVYHLTDIPQKQHHHGPTAIPPLATPHSAPHVDKLARDDVRSLDYDERYERGIVLRYRLLCHNCTAFDVDGPYPSWVAFA